MTIELAAACIVDAAACIPLFILRMAATEGGVLNYMITLTLHSTMRYICNMCICTRSEIGNEILILVRYKARRCVEWGLRVVLYRPICVHSMESYIPFEVDKVPAKHV